RFSQCCIRGRQRRRRLGRIAGSERLGRVAQRACRTWIRAANVGGAIQSSTERLTLYVRKLVRVCCQPLQRVAGRARVLTLESVAQRLRLRLGSQRLTHCAESFVSE